MTLENAKILYAHFKEAGMTKNVEEYEAKYPELKEAVKPEVKENAKKFKGK